VEFIFEIFGELIIQLIAEVLFQFGLNGLSDVFKRGKKRNPVLAAFGYFLWGTMTGGISLYVFPQSMIRDPELRIMNLWVSPAIAGLAMAGLGTLRQKKGKDRLRINTFFYGSLFAFGLAFVRYIWAHGTLN